MKTNKDYVWPCYYCKKDGYIIDVIPANETLSGFETHQVVCKECYENK